MGVLLALGLGFFTSVLGGETRDLRLMLGYVFGFWFFITPVVYPLSPVPESLRWLAAVCPMTTIMELFRWGMFGTGTALPIAALAITPLFLLALNAAGLWFVLRTEAAIDRV
jgi:lipopolysaccharide transport system permease protein